MMATLSSRSSRRYHGAEIPSGGSRRHPRNELAEAQTKRDKAKGGGGQDEGGGAESEDEDEEEEDCFFESFDRIPSRVSVSFELPSDSDSEDDDDVRVSFSSAVAPPLDFRCVTRSREEFLAELELEEAAGRTKGAAGDYDVWSMEEPMSIKDRRRRLLQGMGFNSRRDFAASLRIASTRRRAPVPDSPDKKAMPKAARPPLPPMPQTGSPLPKEEEATEPLPIPPAEEEPEVEQEDPPAQLSRRRSESDLARQQPTEPALVRCASSPASLCRLSTQEPLVVGGADGGGAVASVAADGNSAADDEVAAEEDAACPTKDAEDEKERAVEEVSNKESSKGKANVTMAEEFERFYSPIVKELMRRVKGGSAGGSGANNGSGNSGSASSSAAEQKSSSSRALAIIPKAPKPPAKPPVSKKKSSWMMKNIKYVASSVSLGLITDKEKEKPDAGPKAATKASADSSSSSELMKVHQHGKSHRELSGLYMSQEIEAHQGAIWSIKFSYDGLYLASAGEDRIVQVWQVQETPAQEMRSLQAKPENAPPETPVSSTGSGTLLTSKKPLKKSKSKKRSMPDYIVMPEVVFALSEKPFCSFEGHGEDVLDLCWSKSSQHLLSSSMDKTVRLWHIETKTCVKLFVHNDYVTCIQFNPTDDKYFISGSLDSKVRIWNVPDRQVVDWSDLHEMVTAVSYTPDGQGAYVGSHKGNCRVYKISENKLAQESLIEIKNKKKKYNAKKITGLQFAPDSASEMMITSADSQVRVFDELKMVQKYKGFRNISSQIAASYTCDGHYVVSASEDSNVYVWKRDTSRATTGKIKIRSHENFFCKDVSVAIPWPSAGSTRGPLIMPAGEGAGQQEAADGASTGGDEAAGEDSGCDISQSGAGNESFASATGSMRDAVGSSPSMTGGKTGNAWGLVVVTAGLGGAIRVFQNFGTPVRLNKQAMF